MGFWKSVRAALPGFRAAADYEGAAATRRTSGWTPPASDINTLVFRSADSLRSRSRDMVRRNPWATNALDAFVGNCIGTGIKLQALHADAAVKEQVQSLWLKWTDDADASGLTDFYGLQALACRSVSFVDGAEFGSGNKAATGLVRLPNTGGVKWRKADGSGDLGLALNANDRLAADAVIDFAPGQTFGAFSYPDASYGNKGIVQIDAAGGLAVEAGVLSMGQSGAAPGTYPKVTIDAKGRVTAGANLTAGDLPGHTHAASDIVSGELPHKFQKDGTDVGTRRALNLVQGTRVSLAAADDPANDRVSVTISASPPEAGEITNALGYVPANRAGEHFTGPIDCGPHQTIGGPFENMAKHSEDFSAAAWDKNGGSCTVTSDAIIAPDGNQTADVVTAVTSTPVIQQQVASLVDGGTYTFYIWARVPSGTRKVSLAIVNNAYAAYLAGPTQVTLTASWQRLKITGSLASGQTGLWIVVRQYAANGDDWTTGDIHLWGACLQQSNDPQKAYARTWASQTPHANSGLAAGPTVIAAADSATSPLKIHGPGSDLADSTLLELTANGELILAGGSGNGYRFAELGTASNPSGWSGVLRVKTPAGTTLGYILLYSNP